MSTNTIAVASAAVAAAEIVRESEFQKCCSLCMGFASSLGCADLNFDPKGRAYSGAGEKEDRGSRFSPPGRDISAWEKAGKSFPRLRSRFSPLRLAFVSDG